MLKRTAMLFTASVALAACANESTAPAARSTAPNLDAAWMTPGGEPATVAVGDFSKSPVMAMAQAHGFFADENLTVTETQTPSSPVIFRNLKTGTWPIILTQIDNVFNYRYNASNPIGETFEPVAIGGTDWGNGASLMARPGFTYEDIRGKNVIVDSPNSGFAFVLYGILRSAGLEKGVDYNVVTTGGTPFRYADLVRGYTTTAVGHAGEQIPVAATILNAGYQFRAEAAGMAHLGDIQDAASPFMGGSIVAERGWLDANGDVAIRFLRAYKRAQTYVLDPANKDEVLAWLVADAKDQNVGQKSYDLLLRGGEGLIPDAGIDTKGLYQTAALRNSFGGFDQPQNLRWLVTPASGMYDLSYWRFASAPRGQN